MSSLSKLAFGCAVIAMAGGLVLAKAQQSKETALIAGDGPVTVDQVVQKLKADGWSEIVISRNGRYLNVSGLVNGQSGKVAVDSQTGQFKADADDDDDDD
jgi:NAD(P)H-flavin reductase